MRINDRDKKLLLVLLALAVFCIPYFLVIRPMRLENDRLQQEITEAQEWNRYLTSLSGQEGWYQEEAQKIAVKREEILECFPEELPQEATILFLADMERRIPISFLQVVYGQEIATGVSDAQPVTEESAQKSVSEKEAEMTEEMIAQIEEAVSGENEITAQTVRQTALTENMTGKCISSEYTYTVDYENWKEFLHIILQEQDRMVITEMDASFLAGGKIEGSFKMSQYAIQGAGRESAEIKEPVMTHGTTNIFRQAAGKGSTEAASDFFLMLSPPDAEVETKIFGRSDDASESSYLRSDSNDKQEITITLQGESGAYMVFCEIGGVTYEEDGISFQKDGMIQLEILSTPRLGDKDQAGAILHLINETDTTLGVRVLDDDEENPRVDIRTKTGAILMQ